MKTTPIRSVLMFSVLASSAAMTLGQPSGRPGRGERPDREGLQREVLERFDKNRDGELDEDEREAARESFRRNGPPRLGGRPERPSPGAGRGDRGGRGGRGRGAPDVGSESS